MTEPQPPSPPPKSFVARSIRRIIVEALAVLLMGALVFGIFLELQLPHVGLIIGIIICVAGAPTLELLRMRNSRR